MIKFVKKKEGNKNCSMQFRTEKNLVQYGGDIWQETQQTVTFQMITYPVSKQAVPTLS